jgi:uncharacterized protein YndB with AHSA1/START domain
VAVNERFMSAPPEAVWDALADPEGYRQWVVGSKRIRDADPTWPAPGSRFHHTVGVGPIEINDHTESLEAVAPQRLRLRVKGRPLLTAKVTMDLQPESGGTRVRMQEEPDGTFRLLALNPLFQWATRLRNAESLKRLERLALSKTAPRA